MIIGGSLVDLFGAHTPFLPFSLCLNTQPYASGSRDYLQHGIGTVATALVLSARQRGSHQSLRSVIQVGYHGMNTGNDQS